MKLNTSLIAITFCAALIAPVLASADGMEGGGMSASDRAGLAEGSKSDGAGSTNSGDSTGLKSADAKMTKFEKASPGVQSIAIGHFARTRSLLVAALNEFDAGMRKADPSSLIDVGMFREGLKSRARELDRILDPQARESETGVKYSADTRLLKKH